MRREGVGGKKTNLTPLNKGIYISNHLTYSLRIAGVDLHGVQGVASSNLAVPTNTYAFSQLQRFGLSVAAIQSSFRTACLSGVG